MHERIEELIIAYLHRGATPEQERELFDACTKNPDIADALRRHLTLSLKLRQLRDETEVPAHLRNALLTRINETAVDLPVRAPAHRPLPRWRFLVGSALAGASLATVLFLALPSRPAPSVVERIASVDTVQLTRVDTLVETRYRTRTVYIARNERMHADPGAQAGRPGLADSDRTPVIGSSTVPAADPVMDHGRVSVTFDRNDPMAAAPALAEARVRDGVTYLEQYTAMVGSLEKVSLTAKDRVRE